MKSLIAIVALCAVAGWAFPSEPMANVKAGIDRSVNTDSVKVLPFKTDQNRGWCVEMVPDLNQIK